MGDKRKSRPSLYGTRIYVRGKFFAYQSPEQILNRKTGAVQIWHKLCLVAEGEMQARIACNDLLQRIEMAEGDFPAIFRFWRAHYLGERALKEPRDPVRRDIWRKSAQAIDSQFKVIERAFKDTDVADIEPYHVNKFLKQWWKKRSAQSYRTYLEQFFAWASGEGHRTSNPATSDVITLGDVPARHVEITPADFYRMRDSLLTDERGRLIPSGEMMQCYIDLTFLLAQRNTDVRIMRKNEIDETAGLMKVKPLKTEKTSGEDVIIRISPAIREVLARLKAISRIDSVFLIHTRRGQVYTASGIRSAFDRACARAGVSGFTTKDLRAMALTAGKKAGYRDEQLKVHAAHRKIATTQGYFTEHVTPVSEVILSLPPRPKI